MPSVPLELARGASPGHYPGSTADAFANEPACLPPRAAGVASVAQSTPVLARGSRGEPGSSQRVLGVGAPTPSSFLPPGTWLGFFAQAGAVCPGGGAGGLAAAVLGRRCDRSAGGGGQSCLGQLPRLLLTALTLPRAWAPDRGRGLWGLEGRGGRAGGRG